MPRPTWWAILRCGHKVLHDPIPPGKSVSIFCTHCWTSEPVRRVEKENSPHA